MSLKGLLALLGRADQCRLQGRLTNGAVLCDKGFSRLRLGGLLSDFP